MLACWLLTAARRPLFACSASGRGSAACWSGRAWPSRIGGGCGWQVLLAARHLRAARSAALPRWPLSLRKRWGREMLWHYTVPLVHARVCTPLLLPEQHVADGRAVGEGALPLNLRGHSLTHGYFSGGRWSGSSRHASSRCFPLFALVLRQFPDVPPFSRRDPAVVLADLWRPMGE